MSRVVGGLPVSAPSVHARARGAPHARADKTSNQQPWYAPAKANATQGGPGRTDLYFFGCGVDHKACLKDFVALSGPVPMPPLATFGVWWSHYETYSEQSIKSDVLEKFVEYGCVLVLSATFSSKMPLCSL